MDVSVAFIGFGEAAMAFAGAVSARGYDRKTDDPALCSAKLADFAGGGVASCATLAEALDDATVILSLVTADQALAVARVAAPLLHSQALWIDMNSVAPDTKRAAATLIERAGGRYVDAAIMAPVHPAGRAVPILVSGPHADAAADMLGAIGFGAVRTIDGGIGAAASVKMIRSVMVKGLEALSLECISAAFAAGVAGEVLASLDAGWPEADWARRIEQNLDRMIVHGTRRAAEMEEAASLLDRLGTGAAMTRATVDRQRAIGVLGLRAAGTLAGTVDAIRCAGAGAEAA